MGSAEAIGAAAGYLGAGGTLVVVGMPPSGTRVPFDPTTLAATNRSIVGARMGRAVLARDIRRLIGEWRAGRLKLAELVSARYPLEEINTAIAATTARAARRNVIVFEGSYG